MNSKFKRVEKVKVASQLPAMGVIGRFKNAARWRYHHGTLSGYDELDETFMSYFGSGYGSEMSDCPEYQYKDKNYFVALARDNDRIVKKIKRGNQDGLVVSRGYLLSLMEKRIKDFDLAMKAHLKEVRRNYQQEKPLWDSNPIALLDIIDYITESESEVTEVNFSKTDFDRVPLNNYRGDTDGHNPIFYSILSKEFERNTFERRLLSQYYTLFSAGQLSGLKTNPHYYKMGLKYPNAVIITEYAQVRKRALA